MVCLKELNNLNKKHFDSEILQDKLLCIYHNFNLKRFLPQIINTYINTSIQKQLVQLEYLFNILLEKLCSFKKDILLIFTRLKHWKISNFIKY